MSRIRLAALAAAALLFPCAIVSAQASAGVRLKTWTNAQYGFSLQYPEGLSAGPGDGAWTATEQYGTDPGTPLLRISVFHVPQKDDATGQPYPLWFDAEVRVGVTADLSACYPPDPGGLGLSSPSGVSINGVTFSHFQYQDAGMGKYALVESYRVVHDGRCYAVEQIERGSMYRDDSMTPGISVDQLHAYYDQAGAIVGTFRFTDGRPSAPPLRPSASAAAASASAVSAAGPQPEHLSFARGTTRVRAGGSVPDAGAAVFQVGASAGQPLLVSVQSTSGQQTLSIVGAKDGVPLLDPGRLSDWQGMLTVTQDYRISVQGGPPGEAFTLTVSVPALIRFGAGRVSARRTGSTPGGLPVDYVLSARAGQALLVNLLSPGSRDAIMVRGLEDGRTYLSPGTNWQHGYYAYLRSTQDYVVSVVPPEGSSSAYTLDFMVPALSLPEFPSGVAFPGIGTACIAQNQALSDRASAKRIYSTVDDGKSWRVAASTGTPGSPGTTSNLPAQGSLLDVTFLDARQGWLTSSNGGGLVPRLFRTTDSGAHWTEVDLPPFPGIDAVTVDHVDTEGLALSAGLQGGTVQVSAALTDHTRQSRVYRTHDGGATWVPDPPPPPPQPPTGPAG